MIRWVKWVAIAAGLILMAGCTLQRTSGDSPPRDEATLHGDLVAHMVAAQQAQSAALALWDRVIFGEIVSCQDAIAVPEPVTLTASELAAYPRAQEIQVRLNEAIKAARDSSDLWNIECADPREQVPLTMARSGRAVALAASDPLAQASLLLAQWTYDAPH